MKRAHNFLLKGNWNVTTKWLNQLIRVNTDMPLIEAVVAFNPENAESVKAGIATSFKIVLDQDSHKVGKGFEPQRFEKHLNKPAGLY